MAPFPTDMLQFLETLTGFPVLEGLHPKSINGQFCKVQAILKIQLAASLCYLDLQAPLHETHPLIQQGSYMRKIFSSFFFFFYVG